MTFPGSCGQSPIQVARSSRVLGHAALEHSLKCCNLPQLRSEDAARSHQAPTTGRGRPAFLGCPSRSPRALAAHMHPALSALSPPHPASQVNAEGFR